MVFKYLMLAYSRIDRQDVTINKILKQRTFLNKYDKNWYLVGYVYMKHLKIVCGFIDINAIVRYAIGAGIMDVLYMSLVMRKPVFGVCAQVRLKPACSATEIS